MYLAKLCSKSEKYKHFNDSIMSDKYMLFTRFNNENFELIVSRSSCKPENSIVYSKNNKKRFFQLFMDFISDCNLHTFGSSRRFECLAYQA